MHFSVRHILLMLLFAVLLVPDLFASDCGKGYDKVQVLIHPDKRYDETSWSLRNYYTGELYDTARWEKGDTVCVPAGTCLRFTIYDAYGDGMCCGQGNGYYQVLVNGRELASGGQFASKDVVVLNCREGLYCNNPIKARKGTQVAPFRDAWYSFVTDTTGIWEMSTCGLGNKCDTRLYTYARCQGITYHDGNVGTQFYNDNSADCDSLQARINAYIKKGDTLLIRVGDRDTDCTGTIKWSINYQGAVKGCMDSSACNYKPQATVSDGTCIYPPNAICPLPDLAIDEAEVYKTMFLDTIYAEPKNCMLAEGCLRGSGLRYVLKFSTHIRNIGEADFVLGDATGDASHFIVDPCHGHWHYKEFIQHTIFDSRNQRVRVSQKDGFCISDLECNKGIRGSYGCNYMGITPGCGDVYDVTVPCQWVDITGLDTGVYTLVVEANWRKEPDRFGHIEHRFDNNFAHVCFRVDKDANGIPHVTKLSSCPIFKDCKGEAFGYNTTDCNGVCGGKAIQGDIDQNGVVNDADVDSLLSKLVKGELKNTACNNLNGDGNLNVADALSLNNCLRYRLGILKNAQEGIDYCTYPSLTNALTDTVIFEPGEENYGKRYFEINISNPYHRLMAFELKISGLEILRVENIIPSSNFSIYYSADGHIAGLAKDENGVPVNKTIKPFLRVYCKDKINSYELGLIISAINENYEKMLLSNKSFSVGISE